MQVDLDDLVRRAEAKRAAEYEAADEDRLARRTTADAQFEEALRALRVVEELASRPMASAPPAPNGNGHAVVITQPTPRAGTIGGQEADDDHPATSDPSEVGLTTAIREAINALSEPYTTTRVSRWIQGRYPALHVKRKYIPSVLNKLTEAGELAKTKQGSATEPSEYRRSRSSVTRS